MSNTVVMKFGLSTRLAWGGPVLLYECFSANKSTFGDRDGFFKANGASEVYPVASG